MSTANKLIEKLSSQIKDFQTKSNKESVGTVLELSDGIAKVSGLTGASYMEMVTFENGETGIILNLEEDSAGVIVLEDYKNIKSGSTAKATGKILEVPVGKNFIGRVIDPLARPIDGGESIKEDSYRKVEQIAKGVITREPVTVPLQTGIKAIDAMIPVGRGQRELIIGDRQTGKTAIVIDAIINQKETWEGVDRNKLFSNPSSELSALSSKPVICIYVAIGQKKSKIAQITAKLEEAGALDYTVIVNASASEPATLSYLAPYTGVTLAEYFAEQGKDVLIAYDDLSKHAQSYRQISLLLKRPSGREAYPGDVFYLHSRLLERACRLNKENGGGSITALPIIETQAGDVSAYIPTNVISITDGQIYLETDLFYQGIRPAVNVGLSVSRVGSAAQTKAVKSVSGQLRLDLAQFRELASFAQFASDLDETTKNQIERGRRVVEVLKQDQFSPLSVAEQTIQIYSATKGFADDIEPKEVVGFVEKLVKFISQKHKKVMETIENTKVLDDKTEKELVGAIEEFRKNFK